MTVPALLFGQGLTLLGTVRCFGRAGLPAHVLTGPDPLAGPSRWFRRWPGATLRPDGYDDLAAFLTGLDLERAVLVPCSDPWAHAVGQLDGALARRFPTVVAPAAAVAAVVDKGRFGQALDEHGIPHPRTFAVQAPGDLASVPDEVLASGFLKPRDSVGFFAAFGCKAFDFRGRAEAEALLERTHAAGLAMLLQEYIPGPADRHYFIDGVVGRGGDFPTLLARRRLRIYPPRFGNSSALVSVPLDEAAGAVASLRRLLPALGWRGIFSAEFKQDAVDGRFKIIEVNPRPWWYVEYADTCGAKVCVVAYHDALDEPVPELPPYRVGVRLVYPYFDWPAWRHGERGTSGSFGQLMRFWIGATQPEWRPDDPLPGILSLARRARSWAARRLPGRGARTGT